MTILGDLPRVSGLTAPDRADAIVLAQQVARAVAGPAAGAVDREARFPTEAIAALREARLLSALVPTRLGGLGCSISEVAEMCDVLGQHCGNTAMVFAMHQVQVAVIARHAGISSAFDCVLHELVTHQRLLASATSEVEIGADVRRGSCTVERKGYDVQLCKHASVISYAEHADAILVTARRHRDAAASDQVLVYVPTDPALTTLTPTRRWDAMGMRGICSASYVVETRVPAPFVLADGYDDISAHTILPVSHILWSSIWLGIATDAVTRARAFLRDAALQTPSDVPAGAIRLAEAVAALQTMRAGVHDAARAYDAVCDDRDALSSTSVALRMNGLTVQSATLVVEIVAQSLGVCGIAGYMADTKYSVERHLRDAYSAGAQIDNDRALASNASMLLVHQED